MWATSWPASGAERRCKPAKWGQQDRVTSTTDTATGGGARVTDARLTTALQQRQETVADLDGVITAAAGGSPDAWRIVYDELSPSVYGYFVMHGAGRDDAEELTNEVFLQVLPKVAQMKGGWSGVKTFTFSVAHARLVDHFRENSRRQQQDEYTHDSDPRLHPSAETEAVGNVAAGELLDVMDFLPPDQKTVIMMRVMADLSLEQTANAMGRSVAAVKKLQGTGLATLRKLLVGHEVSDGQAVGT